METETPGTGTGVRGWLLATLGVAFVALVAYQMWPEQSATPVIPASNRQAANRRAGAARAAAARGEIDPAELKVRLDALQAKPPDFGEHERNPFRFQPPPAPPPPPKSVAPPTEPSGPPLPPPPPPIPPVPLKFMGTVEKPGLTLAALTDCKGFSYAAREGEIIDGRYRLVKIQVESVILEYSNGTGRTTVRKSGDCPK
jgi:hypothetical protein